MIQLDRAERLLAYGIAALAGYVDATGFLAADRYFVSFMSGNTTRLGVELAQGATPAAVAGGLIVGFTLGVAMGAVVAEHTLRHRKSTVLGLCCALLALAAVGHALGSTAAFLGGSVLAMGAINNVFRRDGGVALGITYMTGALVRMGEGLASLLTGQKGRKGAVASMILWASLASGAVGGALASNAVPGVVPWTSPLILLALLGFAKWIEGRAIRQA